RLPLRRTLPLHGRLARLEFRRRRSRRLSRLLLVLVACPDEVVATAPRLSLRVGARRPWRRQGPKQQRNARAFRRPGRRNGEGVGSYPLQEFLLFLLRGGGAPATIDQVLLAAGPSGMGRRIDVERELGIGLTPSRADAIGGAVVKHDVHEVVVGVNALLH